MTSKDSTTEGPVAPKAAAPSGEEEPSKSIPLDAADIDILKSYVSVDEFATNRNSTLAISVVVPLARTRWKNSICTTFRMVTSWDQLFVPVECVKAV